MPRPRLSNTLCVLSIRYLSAGNSTIFILGISPSLYPKFLASTSYCTRLVDTTISPISISALREPAIPVLITVSTPYTLASIWVHIPAFTFPMPERTSTSLVPFTAPLKKDIPAMVCTSSTCMCDFKFVISSSIAPIIPIIYLLLFYVLCYI